LNLARLGDSEFAPDNTRKWPRSWCASALEKGLGQPATEIYSDDTGIANAYSLAHFP